MTYTQFKDTYSVRLNRQQEEAVRQTEGPVLLLAMRTQAGYCSMLHKK